MGIQTGSTHTLRLTDLQAARSATAITALFLATMLFNIKDVAAETTRLQWDPVNDSRVDYYELHYGTESGHYQSQVKSATTETSVTGLEQGATYYFAARACDATNGECGLFSNEISITIPDSIGGTQMRSANTVVSASGSTQWAQTVDGGQSKVVASMNEASRFPIEIGDFEVDHEWRWVEYQQRFVDPIVVVKALSANGSDPAVIRVKDVGAEGFWVRVQEWDYKDGWHVMEQASYVAMERGSYELPGGVLVEAGSLSTAATGAFQYQAFGDPFGEAPVVFAAVVSANEADAVNARIRDVSINGFQVGLIEQESNAPSHVAERVDYIAWQASSGEVDGLRFEVGRMTKGVSDLHQVLAATTTFAQAPIFIADLQTTNGTDPSALRWNAPSATEREIWVQEEQSWDVETNHLDESAGYFFADVEE